MVKFSNLAGKTFKLQYSHPITVIERNLETLAVQESNRIDIETVQACLIQLLSKKQREEELQKEYQDIATQISNSVDEKDKIDEEITQLNLNMEELAEKLHESVILY